MYNITMFIITRLHKLTLRGISLFLTGALLLLSVPAYAVNTPKPNVDNLASTLATAPICVALPGITVELPFYDHKYNEKLKNAPPYNKLKKLFFAQLLKSKVHQSVDKHMSLAFMMREIAKNSFDSIVDKITELGIAPENYDSRITLQVYHDSTVLVLSCIDNGKPIEFKEDGTPTIRKRKHTSRYFSEAHDGYTMMKKDIAKMNGTIEYTPLEDGTKVEIKIPLKYLWSKPCFDDDQRIIVVSEDAVLRKMARVRREMISQAVRLSRVVYAKEDDPILAESNAKLLTHGKVLLSPRLKNDPLKQLRAIFHEEIEAIMQIIARQAPLRYSAIREMILSDERIRKAYAHTFPKDKAPELEDDLLVNDMVATAFELLLLSKDNLITDWEMTFAEGAYIRAIRPAIMATKHNYFTNIFWDQYTREMEIRTATASGQRFYEVASINSNPKNSQKVKKKKTLVTRTSVYDLFHQGGEVHTNVAEMTPETDISEYITPDGTAIIINAGEMAVVNLMNNEKLITPGLVHCAAFIARAEKQDGTTQYILAHMLPVEFTEQVSVISSFIKKENFQKIEIYFNGFHNERKELEEVYDNLNPNLADKVITEKSKNKWRVQMAPGNKIYTTGTVTLSEEGFLSKHENNFVGWGESYRERWLNLPYGHGKVIKGIDLSQDPRIIKVMSDLQTSGLKNFPKIDSDKIPNRIKDGGGFVGVFEHDNGIQVLQRQNDNDYVEKFFARKRPWFCPVFDAGDKLDKNMLFEINLEPLGYQTLENIWDGKYTKDGLRTKFKENQRKQITETIRYAIKKTFKEDPVRSAHGHLHFGNILVKIDNEGELEDIKIIDWKFLAKESLPEDLTALINKERKNLKNAELNGIGVDSDTDIEAYDFQKQNLTNATLKASWTNWSNFENTILKSANLSYAMMMGTIFISSDLRKAKLIHTSLAWANFENADLRGANLTWANLMNACLSYAKLAKADLTHTDLRGVNLTNVDFSQAILKYTKIDLEQADFMKNQGYDVLIQEHWCLVTSPVISTHQKKHNITREYPSSPHEIFNLIRTKLPGDYVTIEQIRQLTTSNTPDGHLSEKNLIKNLDTLENFNLVKKSEDGEIMYCASNLTPQVIELITPLLEDLESDSKYSKRNKSLGAAARGFTDEMDGLEKDVSISSIVNESLRTPATLLREMHINKIFIGNTKSLEELSNDNDHYLKTIQDELSTLKEAGLVIELSEGQHVSYYLVDWLREIDNIDKLIKSNTVTELLEKPNMSIAEQKMLQSSVMEIAGRMQKLEGSKNIAPAQKYDENKFEQYLIKNGLDQLPHLKKTFTPAIKSALLRDPILRPVFLRALPNEHTGEIVAVDPIFIAGESVTDIIMKYSVFKVGSPEIANELIEQGETIVVGVTDRTADKKEMLKDIFVPVANGRQAYFPLADGTWLGIKGCGQFSNEQRAPWYIDNTQCVTKIGLAWLPEAHLAHDAMQTLQGTNGRFIQMLGYRSIYAAPNGKGGFKSTELAFDKATKPYPAALIFNRVATPHRLVKFPQLYAKNAEFQKRTEDISRSLTEFGFLPIETILSTEELINMITCKFGQQEAIKQNKGLWKSTKHSQDYTLAGEEADNEEFRDIYASIIQLESQVDVENLPIYQQLLFHNELDISGIVAKLFALTDMLKVAHTNQIDVENNTLFPEPAEIREILLKSYFMKLENVWLNMWAADTEDEFSIPVKAAVEYLSLFLFHPDIRDDDLSPSSEDRIKKELCEEIYGWAKDEVLRREELLTRISETDKLLDSFKESCNTLRNSSGGDYSFSALSTEMILLDRQKEGESLILYADDILSSTMAVDIDYTMNEILSSHSTMKNGKIIIFAKNEAAGDILNSIIKKTRLDVETFVITKVELKNTKNVTGSQADEMNALVNFARTKGATDILGLIRGPSQQPEDLTNICEKLKIPVVTIGHEEGLYSFSRAIVYAANVKDSNGAEGWFIVLRPISPISEDIKAMHQAYLSALQALISA